MYDSEIAKSVGLRIRACRKEKDLTQFELAEKAGLHGTYIGQLERGEKLPTIRTAFILAKALKVPVIRLIDDDFIAGDGYIPSKWYGLLASKSKEEQDRLYRIIEMIDD